MKAHIYKPEKLENLSEDIKNKIEKKSKLNFFQKIKKFFFS
jgi:hypothetical protein